MSNFQERDPKTGQFVVGAEQQNDPNINRRMVREAKGDIIRTNQIYLHFAAEVAWELLKLIKSKDTPATAKIAAIKEWNDRGLGRRNDIAMSADDDKQIDLSNVSEEALQEIVNALKVPAPQLSDNSDDSDEEE